MWTPSAFPAWFARAAVLAVSLLATPIPASAAEDAGCPACALTMSVTRAAPTTTQVSATPYVFTQASVTINAGDTVTWTNNSSTAIDHTTTSDTGVWDSGTLHQGQSFSFTFVTAGTFHYHCSFHQSLGMVGVITVNAGAVLPVITSATSASGTVGSPFSFQVSATDSPTSFGATGLPAGLAIDGTSGLISGTPSAAAAGAAVAISATNGAGTATATLTLTIAAPAAGTPVISSASSASGIIGVAFTYSILASESPTSFAASALPSGLSLNAASGVISGTPDVIGMSNVTISASNGSGTGSTSLEIIIGAPAGGGAGTGTANYGSSGHCGLGAGASALFAALLAAVRVMRAPRLRQGRIGGVARPGTPP